MQQLFSQIFVLVASSHADKVKQLIELLPHSTCAQITSTWPTNAAMRAELNKVFNLMPSLEIDNKELALLIQGIAFGRAHERESEQVELVWTGPDTDIVPVRKTSRVLRELIDSSNKTLLITSYASYPLPEIETAINQATARGVEVSFLIETETYNESDSFLNRAKELAARMPRVAFLIWPSSERTESGWATLHAKCAVADAEICLITSANFTEAAMDRNLEVGMLVRGGTVPKNLSDQFSTMLVRGIIRRLNG